MLFDVFVVLAVLVVLAVVFEKKIVALFSKGTSVVGLSLVKSEDEVKSVVVKVEAEVVKVEEEVSKVAAKFEDEVKKLQT